MAQGKVYLVGTGPGDLELITLKGYRLITRAEVILYDHLMPQELLQLASEDAELFSVGKFAGKHTMPQEQMNALLVKKARQGKTVVRLKGGDPYIFGRGGEEAEACVEAGVEFEEVPGITSAIAAASYAGIPPTHRDFTPNVAIVTGHRRDEKEIEIPKAGTVIFLMSVRNLPKIVSSLLAAGWSDDTKIAAVEKGTRYDQRVITGTLGDFLDVAEKAQLRTPAIFIVGKVVELHEKLDWFGKRPRIFLPGTHPEKYQHLGTIVHRPMIKSVALDDYSAADPIFDKLGGFDWIIFTSTNGVKFFFSRLNAVGLDSRALAGAKIAAIGRTTAERLKYHGVLADMRPALESSVGLLDEFDRIGSEGLSILLVRPKVGRNELIDGLQEAGANVQPVVVYENVQVESEPVDFDYIDWILFTSGSTVRAFMERYGELPQGKKVYCLGKPTLERAQSYDIEAQLLPGS